MEAPLKFINRDEWRVWLAENHNKSKGAWLLIGKKNSKNAFLSYEDAVEEALCFGWIDSIVKKRDVETFLQWYASRRTHSIWSVSNKRRAEKLIAEGRMTEDGLRKIEEARRNGNWEQTLGTPKDVIPKDFRNALDSNKKAQQFFLSLSKTNRYLYVYWISSAKKETTRQQRIAKAVERLSIGEKLTD
jgi:uncharacterized protein YdeI (YjbR/CyaY-like superfamily)